MSSNVVTNADIVTILVLECTDASSSSANSNSSTPDPHRFYSNTEGSICWESVVGYVYACTSLLYKPLELKKMFFSHLNQHGGSRKNFLAGPRYRQARSALESWKMEVPAPHHHHHSAIGGDGGGVSPVVGQAGAIAFSPAATPTAAARRVTGGNSPAAVASPSSALLGPGKGGLLIGSTVVPITPTMKLSKDVLLTVWAKCNALKGADWFRDSVNPETMMVHAGSELGPWRKAIKKTSSVNDIKHRINTGEITTMGQLKVAFLHVTTNSVMFNAPQGDYPPAARSYAQLCVQLFDSVLSEDTAATGEASCSSAPAAKKQRVQW